MGIREGIVLIFLGLNTYSDLRYYRIILGSAAVFGGAGILLGLYANDRSLLDAAVSLVPGFFFLGVSKITREALGYGDGIIVLVLGIYLTIQELLLVLMTAMLLAAVWAGILLIFMKKGKGQEFPFLPFLLLGYLGKVWIL